MSSKARKLLFASFGDDNVQSKLLSQREDGRKLYEIIDLTTGDTRAFQISYPDGRIETRIVSYDYTKDFEG